MKGVVEMPKRNVAFYCNYCDFKFPTKQEVVFPPEILPDPDEDEGKTVYVVGVCHTCFQSLDRPQTSKKESK